MNDSINRRHFLQAATIAGAGFALPRKLFAAGKKSVLMFTKSSGFEHESIKVVDGKPSVMQKALTELGPHNNLEVTATKDGRIFSSKEFQKFDAIIFFTTGVLTTPGTDKNPPMTSEGKQALLDAIHGGMGFVGVHAAADTFHTQPDPADESNRYIVHGDKSDPYLRMLGGEFITHGNTPRLQDANVVIDDPKFPGLEGVNSPVRFKEEWYSFKDFRDDIHVILSLDTKGMTGEPYQRAPYPVTWARMEGKGRVFYTAIGDRPENWSTPFFRNVLAGGLRWVMHDANANLTQNLKQATPGYAEIPPKPKD
jgi:type 1 glutamine amidotransferase